MEGPDAGMVTRHDLLRTVADLSQKRARARDDDPVFSNLMAPQPAPVAEAAETQSYTSPEQTADADTGTEAPVAGVVGAPRPIEVLEVEVLETLAAMTQWDAYQTQSGFVGDKSLLRLAKQVAKNADDAAGLLEALYSAKDSLQDSRRAIPRGEDGRLATELTSAPLTTTPPDRGTAAERAQAAIESAGIELNEALADQPGAETLVRLVPVEIGGEGEYAISFRTVVEFDMKTYFSDGTAASKVNDFVEDLFEPSQWPKRHAFWLSMDEVLNPSDDANELMSRMAEAASAVPAEAAVSFGQRRVFNEAVGSERPEGGTWPNTILVFADSHRAVDGTNVSYLEYRLVPNASDYLDLDDGTIQVLVTDGTNVACTITKMLFFKESRYSSQAEAMADYALAGGWAEQTRAFLMHWVAEKEANAGGTP